MALIGVTQVSTGSLFLLTLGVTVLGYVLAEGFLASDPCVRSRWLAAGVIIAVTLFVGTGALFIQSDQEARATQVKPGASASPSADRSAPPKPSATITSTGPVSPKKTRFSGKAQNLASGSTLWLVDQDEYGEYWALSTITSNPNGDWSAAATGLDVLEDGTARISVAYVESAVDERMLYDQLYDLSFFGIPRARISDLLLVTRTFEVEKK